MKTLSLIENKVLPPPMDQALVHHRRMRQAWNALGAYVLTYLFFAACFEWQAYKSGVVGMLLFFQAFFFISASFASFIVFVRLVIKRAFAPALVFAFIASTVIVISASASNRLSFDMQMKARIFAAYPNLCQTPIVSGQRVSICYKYSVNDIGGEFEQIYFNPGDEMSLPPRQWPVDIKREFLGVRATRENLSEDELCGLRKTRRIVNHVYWIHYDCWGY